MTMEKFQNAIVREVAEWPDVQIEFRQGASHPRARLKFGVSVQTVSFPDAPGAGSASEDDLAKVRKALSGMGASRAAAPAEPITEQAHVGRAETVYADGGAVPKGTQDIPVDQPQAGFYRFRINRGAIRGGVRIWHGPPLDPITGEEMDRSHRWQALHDDAPIEFDLVWPACAGDPITEAEYRELVQRRQWARENAPDSAYAEPGRRHDPLSMKSPLPF